MKTPLTTEQFLNKLNALCAEKKTADILINGDGNRPGLGFTGLPAHLQKDALIKMGLTKVECPISGSIQYFEL